MSEEQPSSDLVPSVRGIEVSERRESTRKRGEEVTLKEKLSELAEVMEPEEESLVDKVLEVIRTAKTQKIPVGVTVGFWVTVGNEEVTDDGKARLDLVEDACENLGGALEESFSNEKGSTSTYKFT